jgi:hypothetical protein
MAPVIVSPNQVVPQRGVFRHGALRSMGPGWLPMDGVTEHNRAAYPDFLALMLADADGKAMVLAGSSAATFRMMKVPYGTSLVASGFDNASGVVFGAREVTLAADQMPQHDHAYQDSQPVTETGQRGLLAGLLPVVSVTNVTARDTQRTTARAGSATPKPVPTQSPSMSGHLFIFAGRPRTL